MFPEELSNTEQKVVPPPSALDFIQSPFYRSLPNCIYMSTDWVFVLNLNVVTPVPLFMDWFADTTTNLQYHWNNLITAGQFINDTFTILENEERRHELFLPPTTDSPTYSSIFHGLASPLGLSSSLRVTPLSSILHNDRELLSAITCPSERLAEMFAPPSSTNPTFTPGNDSWYRSLFQPGPCHRARKQSTWNKSYASLAGTPSPLHCSFQLVQRREKQRSDLNAVLQLGTTASPAHAGDYRTCRCRCRCRRRRRRRSQRVRGRRR